MAQEDTTKNALATTVPMPPPEVKPDGNGDGKALSTQKAPLWMSGGQLAGMTTSKELPNALNFLVNPGDSTLAMTMRTVVPEKRTEASRMVDIYSFFNMKATYFKSQIAKDAFLFKMGLMVSVNGRGRTELVSGITGERQHEENKGGFGNMFKRLAWGESKKDG